MLVAFPSLIFAIITLLIYFTYKSKTEAKLDDLKMELLGESENKTSFEAKYNQALSELKRYEDLKKGKELDEIQLLFAKVNMLDDKITFLNSSFKNKLDTIISMVESIKSINEDNSSLIKNIIIDNSDNDDEEDLKNNIDNSFNHIADQEKPENNEEKEEQNVSNTAIEDNDTTNDLKEENKVEDNNSNVANNINEDNRTAPIFATGYANDFKKNDDEVDANKIFSSKKDDNIFDDPSSYDDAFLEEDNEDEETEKAYDFNDVFEQEQEKEHKEAETEVEANVEPNNTADIIENSTDNENAGNLLNNENSDNAVSSRDNNEENVNSQIISDITADSSSIANEINDVNELDNHEEAIMNDVKENTVNVENMSVKPDTNISGGNADDDCKNMEIDNFVVNAQGTPFDNPKSCDIGILDKNKEVNEQQEMNDNSQTTTITEQQEINNNLQKTVITEQQETNSVKTTENTLNNDIDEEVKQVVDMQNAESEHEEDLKKEPNEELVKEDEIEEVDNQEENEEDKNKNNNEGIYNDFPPAPDYVENNDNNLNSDNQKKQPTTSISNNSGFDIKESIEKLKAQLNESGE